MKYFFFAAVLFLVSQASAKELYMTVRRDYAPTENAAIELNYYSDGPIQLRVLAPKDLKAFIASQIDLRRSWKQPRVQFNPMYFLAKGMNESSFDTDWVRLSMNSKVRKEIPEMGGAANTSGAATVATGPEKLISSPEAFTLVTEQFIVPESEDKNKAFDVPGFDSWFGTHGPLRTKIIELPKLAPGFYVVQTIQGDSEGQVVVVVNDLLAQLQQTTGKGLYQVSDRSGAPLSGAAIGIRNLNGQWVAHGKTDANGKWMSEVKENDLISLIEAPKAGTAIIDSEFFATTAVFPDLYLYTDRPMYRKGDVVSFRGILRERKGGKSQLTKVAAGTSVKVELVSTEGKPAASTTTVKVTKFGTFSGSFKLAPTKDEGGDEGVFRVIASVAGERHSGELRVKDYVKPVFFVKVTSEQETARAGETLNAKIKAERYAGGVPTGARARAQLYRVKMETPQWVDDAGLGETGSTVTYGADAAPSSGANLPILIEEKLDIELDAKAEGTVSFTLPKELPGAPGFDYKFQLKVVVTDADEKFAVGSASFLDLNSEVSVQARFNKILAESSKAVTLTIRGATPSGKGYPKAKGRVEFTLTPYAGQPKSISKKDIVTDDSGVVRLEIPQVGNGELRAVVTLHDKNNRPASSDASVIIASEPPEKGVISVAEMKLITEDSVTQPGATVRLLALMPGGWGVNRGKKGSLYLTVAGRSIYDHRVIPLDGVGKWIEQKIDASYGSSVALVVSYSDPNGGWTERRANFRIVDPSQGLKVSVVPERAEVQPGGSQTVKLKVLDASGKPVQSEVSLAVVDRSVLDLQPEIRPSLLDFFYPSDRLNLMVFLSSQFQGYGYLEKVAKLFKPNYWFAATKNPSEVLDQKDTAHWVGNLTTDAKGEATATFKLPGNQTIWRAIAVAADTNGHFGEGQSEFKANMPVSMLLGYPQFLRRGDEAVLRVNLSAQKTTSPVDVSYRFEAPKVLSVSEPLNAQASLKSGEEISKTTRITALNDATPQTVQMISRMKVGTSDLSFGNAIRIATDSTDQPKSFEAAGNKISFALAANEVARSATLRVSSGLYGSLLPSLRWLVRYPYGCVEQLTSSTVPNLVFGRVLTSAKLVLSKEEEQIAKDADTFGRSGLNRLKTYLKPKGELSWFASESAGDANMSLLVLEILAGLDDSVISNFQTTFDYLRSLNYVPASSQGIALTYIDAALRKNYSRGSELKEDALIPLIKTQGDWAMTEKGSVTDRALLAIAIHKFAMKDKGVEAVRAKLIASLKESIASAKPNDRWTPAQANDFVAYPGRIGSSLALAGRAVHLAATKAERPANLLELVRREVMKSFDGESYGSTFETAGVLIHSRWIIEEELKGARMSLNHKGAITINGQALKETPGMRRPTLGGFDIDVDAKILGSKAEIQIAELPATSAARLVTRVGLPLSKSTPVVNGWALDRKYFRLGDKGAKSPFDPAKDKVRVGDLVYVEISLARAKAKTSAYWASRYYVLTEQIPAGFQIIDDDKIYEAAPYSLPIRGANFRVREPSSDQMRWFFDFTRGWMDRAQSVGFVMRANYAGRYQTGLTRMEDFYDDDAFSQTSSAMVTIEPQAAGK